MPHEFKPPKVVILAGPNGAGKSTAAPRILRGALQVSQFVNADTIASGLSAFDPEGVAFEAGRIMIQRLNELGQSRTDFAFETTLATRSYARRIRELIDNGYEFHLVFLYLPDAHEAVARVAQRVAEGGHNIPRDVILKRYELGLRNFFELFQELASGWYIYDNSSGGSPGMIACGSRSRIHVIANPTLWERIRRRYGHK